MMDYKVTHVKYKFINFWLFMDDSGTDLSGYFLTSVHYINYRPHVYIKILSEPLVYTLFWINAFSKWEGSVLEVSQLLIVMEVWVQFSSVAQSCLTLCDPVNRSTPGLPVHHQLPEFTQTHIHRVGDAIQPSHPLSSPSPPAPNPSQHQRLFQWVNSSREVAKVLELQSQWQSFQWTPRTGLL